MYLSKSMHQFIALAISIVPIPRVTEERNETAFEVIACERAFDLGGIWGVIRHGINRR